MFFRNNLKLSRFAVLAIVLFMFQQGRAEDQAVPLLKAGDRIIGLKLALGSVFGSNIGFVVNGEYGFKDNVIKIEGLPNSLGLGGSFGYSSYSEFEPLWGNYSYQNYLLLGSAFWHVDFFNRQNIDTYCVANLGLNIDVTSKPGSLAPGRSSAYGGIVFGLALGGRYYYASIGSRTGNRIRNGKFTPGNRL
ncbi:MAG: hypothetical protein GXO77_14945 [Calditrichaeota bacterium]|nr:hypothetical protein [Calditrichota bacterium]